MDWTDFLLNIILLVIEGFILAIVLNYWQEWTGKRKEKRELAFVFGSIYKYLQKKEVQDLYYYLKLASERDKGLIQQILRMEIILEAQTGNFGDKEEDVLIMKNGEYALYLDNSWESYIVAFKIKEEDDPSIAQKFYFSKPPQNMKSFSLPYQKFLLYIEERCKKFGIRF